MEQMISGLVVSLLTEAGKRIPWIPLNGESINIVRLVSAVLSVLSQLGYALTNGVPLGSINWAGLGIASVITYVYAIISYHGVVKQ